jgi:hypothetical protein
MMLLGNVNQKMKRGVMSKLSVLATIGSLIKQFRTFDRQIVAAIAVMLSLLLAAEAVAGPPFLTDDPVPVDLHHWELYVATQIAIERESTSGTAPHFEINYGALPDVQLHAIAPFAYDNPRGSNNLEHGFGDTELGVKWRFIHETDWMPQIAAFPITEIPTGDDDKGLGNGKQQVFLPLWAQKSWGKWTTYGGGGYWLNPGEGNKDYWFMGWLLQRQITEKLVLGGEVFHATPSEEDGDSRTGVNFGGIYDFTANYHLLFSAGRDIKGPNLLISYIALQITF